MTNTERSGLIYIIRNTINDKVYIGQTIYTLEYRFKQHLKDSDKLDYYFYRSIRKYGKDKFYIELIEDNIKESSLNEKEIYYIKKYDSFNNGYNSSLGGEGVRKIEFLPTKEQLIEWYGIKSLGEIAKEFNCSIVVISRLLQKYEMKWIDKNKYIQVPTKEQLLEWNGKRTQKEIAQEFNCSQSVIWNRIKFYKIKWIDRKNKIILPTKEQLIEWNGIKSQNEIAQEFNCSTWLISKLIKKYGIQYINIQKIDVLPTKEQLLEWNGKRSQKEIAQEFNCSIGNIHLIVKKYNIDWKRKSRKAS